MARKPGSVYEIGKGRYRGVLILKDEFGISFRKEFTGKDPKALRKRMDQFREDYVAGQPTAGMTVKKCCQLAIEACQKRDRAPKTIKGYEDLLRIHIEPTVGAVQVEQLTPAHVERLMGKMEEKGIGTQTQALCRNFLRMALNRIALKGGYVTSNAASLADPPRVRHQTRRPLEPADFDKILAKETRPKFRALWMLLATTGLRPSEARTLLWRDLYAQPDGHWLVLRESKTEEGKQPVPIPAALMEELKGLKKDGLYVFGTANGTQMEEHNLRREWITAMANAEVPFTNLYQLRKLFGTMKARKVNDAVLKRLMRHTDARTTKQYYVTAIEQDLRAAVED